MHGSRDINKCFNGTSREIWFTLIFSDSECDQVDMGIADLHGIHVVQVSARRQRAVPGKQGVRLLAAVLPLLLTGPHVYELEPRLRRIA